MIDKIDAIIKGIGLSPYAVVAGLFLSAIPVVIGIYRSFRVLYFVLRDAVEGNLTKRSRVNFFKDARIAYKVSSKRGYDIYMFRLFVGIGAISSFSILYIIAATSSLAIVLSFGVEHELTIFWKLRILLIACLIISLSIIIIIVPQMKSMVSVSKLRRRILKKNKSK